MRWTCDTSNITLRSKSSNDAWKCVQVFHKAICDDEFCLCVYNCLCPQVVLPHRSIQSCQIWHNNLSTLRGRIWRGSTKLFQNAEPLGLALEVQHLTCGAVVLEPFIRRDGVITWVMSCKVHITLKFISNPFNKWHHEPETSQAVQLVKRTRVSQY